MNRSQETPKNLLTLSEHDKIFISSTLDGALANYKGVSTMQVAILMNSIELFQMKKDQYIKSELLLLWNEYIQYWKGRCIPKIKANAKNWPELKVENLQAIKEFFGWLNTLGLLGKHEEIVKETFAQVDKILSLTR